MANSKTFRPQARPYIRAWLYKDGSSTPGIALVRQQQVLAHFTAEEARAMADKLHDYADQLDQENEK